MPYTHGDSRNLAMSQPSADPTMKSSANTVSTLTQKSLDEKYSDLTKVDRVKRSLYEDSPNS